MRLIGGIEYERQNLQNTQRMHQYRPACHAYCMYCYVDLPYLYKEREILLRNRFRRGKIQKCKKQTYGKRRKNPQQVFFWP